jgi:hypothetical protein
MAKARSIDCTPAMAVNLFDPLPVFRIVEQGGAVRA